MGCAIIRPSAVLNLQGLDQKDIPFSLTKTEEKYSDDYFNKYVDLGRRRL